MSDFVGVSTTIGMYPFHLIIIMPYFIGSITYPKCDMLKECFISS